MLLVQHNFAPGRNRDGQTDDNSGCNELYAADSSINLAQEVSHDRLKYASELVLLPDEGVRVGAGDYGKSPKIGGIPEKNRADVQLLIGSLIPRRPGCQLANLRGRRCQTHNESLRILFLSLRIIVGADEPDATFFWYPRRLHQLADRIENDGELMVVFFL